MAPKILAPHTYSLSNPPECARSLWIGWGLSPVIRYWLVNRESGLSAGPDLAGWALEGLGPARSKNQQQTPWCKPLIEGTARHCRWTQVQNGPWPPGDENRDLSHDTREGILPTTTEAEEDPSLKWDQSPPHLPSALRSPEHRPAIRNPDLWPTDSVSAVLRC